MIENYLLEQFVAFAKHGTLLKASEELHITQPTLSRSMKKLEDELGVQIFHRENSKLSLNETGKVAAEYAEKALAANQDLIDHVISFDRSLRTVSVGACSPFPINDLMPSLQNCLPGRTILSEVSGDDEKLISGLKMRQYDMVILHGMPEDKSVTSQRYMNEQIYLTVPSDHPVASQKSISFAQMKGLRILVAQGIGFWMNVCRKHLNESELLVQNNLEALSELVDASSLPVFNSDRIIEQGFDVPGRVSVPISDEDAHATYWLACRTLDQGKYRSVFNVARSYALRHDL